MWRPSHVCDKDGDEMEVAFNENDKVKYGKTMNKDYGADTVIIQQNEQRT